MVMWRHVVMQSIIHKYIVYVYIKEVIGKFINKTVTIYLGK